MPLSRLSLHRLLFYAARNARFFILLQERTRQSQAIGEMQVPPQGNIQGFRRQEVEDQAGPDHPREARLADIGCIDYKQRRNKQLLLRQQGLLNPQDGFREEHLLPERVRQGHHDD